jgi:glycerol-1-phosphate dehydrogenase [NAD(P)+]
VTFSRGAARGAADRFESCVVITMLEPWGIAGPLLGGRIRRVVFLPDVDETTLQHLANSLPPAEAVIGVGGGSSIDAAKYVAWTRGARLLLVPTILSVDACVTNAVAVRVRGRVRYIADITAEEVLVDYDLLRQAPPYLNRAGIGDVLSIHTALADWRSGAALGGPAWHCAIARESAALLNRLREALPDIRGVTEDGMRALTDLFVAETELCLRAGHSRPEEGTEHYLAYCLEDLARRAYVHGELVCLCIVVMATLQENAPEVVADTVKAAGVRTDLREIGLEEGDLVRAVTDVSRYVKSEGLFPSAVTRTAIDTSEAQRVVALALRRLL